MAGKINRERARGRKKKKMIEIIFLKNFIFSEFQEPRKKKRGRFWFHFVTWPK